MLLWVESRKWRRVEFRDTWTKWLQISSTIPVGIGICMGTWTLPTLLSMLRGTTTCMNISVSHHSRLPKAEIGSAILQKL